MRRTKCRAGFTLIELILVMTILTVALSITAPALANFFRGRSMDYEARRLLALIRHGQSRAVAEGIPIELWIDVNQGKLGLEAEPSYETDDPKAVEFTFDTDLKLDLPLNTTGLGLTPTETETVARPRSVVDAAASTPVELTRHPNVPKIRFMPDGSISETSPQMVRLTGRDGHTLSVIQTQNRLTYEIRTQGN